MGFVGGMLGMGGGAAGTGFSAPAQANLVMPTTKKQADDAYTQAQSGLTNQQNFLNAVNAQNGLGNQSSVFNQLQGVANGTGPNPAQAQLAQATGANVANQAALMAGQRGANANIGLMARQAAQQGAQTQQQSAGQAATLQAQQSLNALQGMGNLANTQAAQQASATQAYTNATQGEQSNLLNAIASQNNANVGMQSNVNSANAGMANTMMGQQGNMMGNIMGGAGAVMGMLADGGVVETGQQLVNSAASTPIPSSPSPQSDQKSSSGGAGLGKLLALAAANGGVVPRTMYANGQYVMSPAMTDAQWDQTAAASQSPAGPQVAQASTPIAAQTSQTSPGPKSTSGKFFSGFNAGNTTGAPPLTGTALAGNIIGKGIGTGLKSLFGHSGSATNMSDEQQEQAYLDADVALGMRPDQIGPATAAESRTGTSTDMSASTDPSGVMAARGGRVPALVSPGEQYIPPKDVKKVKEGKNPLSLGERIPGKPKFPGNDYRNDTVKRNLESGGVVIPNEIMQSKNASAKAAKFVEAILARNKSMPKRNK